MPQVATLTAMPSSATSATEDPRILFARWQQHGDQAAREALVQRFMPLARSLARRYGRSSEPFEDLLQVASLGLLKALDRFDPTLGHPFHVVCRADDPRRDAPVLPRRRLGGARAARHAGARAEGARRPGATREQSAGALRPSTARRVPRAGHEEIIDALQAHPGVRVAVARRPAPRRRRRSDHLRRRDGRRGRALRARRARCHRQLRPCTISRPASATILQHALRRGSDADRDRRARGHLADAGVAPAAPVAGPAAGPHRDEPPTRRAEDAAAHRRRAGARERAQREDGLVGHG